MQKTKNYSTIEDNLLAIQQLGLESSLSIGEILNILSKKGLFLTILILSLPFCQPFQIPGFSLPFGLAIAFLGLKMVFGRYTWLPNRILSITITSNRLQTIIEKILWLTRKMKRWTYPRLVWMCHTPVLQIINGLLIFILGIFLAMPLPIPFSNLIAAWSIFILGLGLFEDDGILIIIGYLASLITAAFFVVTILINWKILLFFQNANQN